MQDTDEFLMFFPGSVCMISGRAYTYIAVCIFQLYVFDTSMLTRD